MKLYLAAVAETIHQQCNEILYKARPPYVLESYFYLKTMEGEWIMDYLKSAHCKSYMIDSGAFTFMSVKVNHRPTISQLDRYLEEYIKFVNKHDVKLFFELDVDSILGIKSVESFRAKLEHGTGKQCIPVWHKSRGKAEFLRLIQEYDYVGIGGIVSKEIPSSRVDILSWFVDKGHEYDCKVHILGGNPKVWSTGASRADSVDNTSWNSPVRYGKQYPRFESGTIKTYKVSTRFKTGMRVEIETYLLNEWSKYARYLDRL